MFGFYDSYFLFFGLEITYYGFIIALAMALAVYVACLNAKYRGLKTDDLIICACYVLPLAIIGARLYYVIFSGESYTFGEVFRIWDGGMAIYGGVIGGAIGVMLYCLIHKKNFLDVGDIAGPSLILGQAIGRIGCYFAGCCYGIEVTNPSHMWFPLSTMIGSEWHYSTFFYESLWDLLGFVVLMLLLRKSNIKQRGAIMSLYLIIYGAGRAWIEGIRGDSLMIGSLKVSQALSLILVVVGLAVIISIYFLTKEKKLKTLKEMGFPEFVEKQNAIIKEKKLKKKEGRLAKKEAKKINGQEKIDVDKHTTKNTENDSKQEKNNRENDSSNLDDTNKNNKTMQ